MSLTGNVTGQKYYDLQLRAVFAFTLMRFNFCRYPNLKSVKELVYKKGCGRLNKQRFPLTDNNLIEQVPIKILSFIYISEGDPTTIHVPFMILLGCGYFATLTLLIKAGLSHRLILP